MSTKSNKPLISVVMPTYNRGHVIRHAINGILDQTFKDYEFIIVDDGSTDNTEQECKKFAKSNPQIKYFKLPHTGLIGKVRNFGNAKAQGELIVVQDSDDVSLPDRLDVLWTEYQNTKADVLYHSMYVVYEDDELKQRMRKYQPAMPYDPKKLLHTQYIPGQVAYTKKAVTKVPYNNKIQISDDWMLLIELCLQGYKFHNIARGLYEYYLSPDSVTYLGTHNNRKVEDAKIMISVLKKKYHADAKFQLLEKELDTGKVLQDTWVK